MLILNIIILIISSYMNNQKYDLLAERLREGAEDFKPNQAVWKTSALNKFIQDHDVRLERDTLTVKAKYRNTTKRVELLKESDLDRVWRENHDQPHLHVDREKTIYKICTK